MINSVSRSHPRCRYSSKNALISSSVAFGRYIYMLYEFGHNLDPKAPVEIEPFMPVVIGTKQIANFTTHSMPHLGSALMGTFTVGVWVITLLYLWRGRREAKQAAALTA